MKNTKNASEFKIVVEGMTFAPGPWAADLQSMLIHPLNGAAVARVYGEPVEIEANAKLIVAAPMMFELICRLSMHVNEKGTVRPLALAAEQLVNDIVCTKARVTK